jgi:hypothetical protein
MVDFKRLADRAKGLVEKRGGTDALKEDAEELREIAQGKGSVKDKAKAAADALKDPGGRGPEKAPRRGGAQPDRGGQPRRDPSAPRPRREPGAGTPPPER